MKILNILAFLLSCNMAIGQNSTAVKYMEIIELDTTRTAKDLYLQARTWFAETYKSSKDVIQFEDRENGKLIGKGNMKYESTIFVGSSGTRGWISYTITISVKDGKYKYDITNFIHEGNSLNSQGAFSFDLITTDKECPKEVGNKNWRNKVYADIKKQIESKTNSLISSLKEYMKNKSNKDDKW